MKVGATVRVPGDKSITHRALLLAAMARGRSRVDGALASLDARATARVLRALGAGVGPLRSGATLAIEGRGRLRRPAGPLHCGNSGTTARLLTGLLAAHRFDATLTGDRSLRRRPMRRVTEPLSRMGARFVSALDGLPLTVHGGRLVPLRYAMPVSSAQIKSALLLAGFAGGVPVAVREPTGRSRDHTERMLRSFGVDVAERGGWIELAPSAPISAFEVQVPGDISSAAYLVGAAVMAESGELVIEGVGVNPTRTAFLDVLARMGAAVEIDGQRESAGEPIAALRVRPAALRGTTVAGAEIPGLIDEIPLLAVLASRAASVTTFHDVGELRVKESDRLRLIADNLRAVGSRAEVNGNNLTVEGWDGPPRGRVRTEGDHRIAMAFAVMATLPGARIAIDDLSCAEVSFPGFPAALAAIRSRGRR